MTRRPTAHLLSPSGQQTAGSSERHVLNLLSLLQQPFKVVSHLPYTSSLGGNCSDLLLHEQAPNNVRFLFIALCFLSNQIQGREHVGVNTSLRLSVLQRHPPVNPVQKPPPVSGKDALLDLGIILDAAVLSTVPNSTNILLVGVILVADRRQHFESLRGLVGDKVALVVLVKGGIEIGQVSSPRGLEMANEGPQGGRLGRDESGYVFFRLSKSL